MNTENIIAGYFEQEKYKVKTSMCKLFEENGSDKSLWHNYTTLYDCLFSKYIGKNINFFELGLGTNNINIPSNMGADGKPGASLYSFRDYFLNANICGADIDDKILFEDDQIWTFYVDQTNPEKIKNMWDCFEDTKFDIIIDDGLHTFDANKIFFDNSIHMLVDGGIYIIEDILVQDKKRFVEEFSNKNLTYINVIELPMDSKWNVDGKINEIDNCLAVIVK
jgi:hypothetical protein